MKKISGFSGLAAILYAGLISAGGHDIPRNADAAVKSLSSPEVYAEVAEVVNKFGAYFTDLDNPQPDALFDRNDPSPMYLAEEMSDWVIGWEGFDWYFHTPMRNKLVQAMDYTPSNIRVKSLSEGLAVATWFVWAEYKIGMRPPVGEHLRATGIMRKTDDGWKMVYYAESPISALAYIEDLYEVMATPEFRKRFNREPKKVEFGIE